MSLSESSEESPIIHSIFDILKKIEKKEETTKPIRSIFRKEKNMSHDYITENYMTPLKRLWRAELSSRGTEPTGTKVNEMLKPLYNVTRDERRRRAEELFLLRESERPAKKSRVEITPDMSTRGDAVIQELKKNYTPILGPEVLMTLTEKLAAPDIEDEGVHSDVIPEVIPVKGNGNNPYVMRTRHNRSVPIPSTPLYSFMNQVPYPMSDRNYYYPFSLIPPLITSEDAKRLNFRPYDMRLAKGMMDIYTKFPTEPFQNQVFTNKHP